MTGSRRKERPIFVSTLFKSGTKLLERILTGIVGQPGHSPEISGPTDYESPLPIDFSRDGFFIWHNVPSAAVKARIRSQNARPIFLIRNVFDLAVSQYFHFALDVDADVGAPTHTKPYFDELAQSDGLSLIICGAASNRFTWRGFGYQLWHTQEILRFSTEYPSCVVMFEPLVFDKRRQVERIAHFLELPVPEKMDELEQGSSLPAMRQERVDAGGKGLHFRSGTPGDHVNHLGSHHYAMISHLISRWAPDLPSLARATGNLKILNPNRDAYAPAVQAAADSGAVKLETR